MSDTTVLLSRGSVAPGTRVVWFFRWDNDSAGFERFTPPAGTGCSFTDLDPIPAPSFPVGHLVTVSVCFVSWEFGTVLCGEAGFVDRVS